MAIKSFKEIINSKGYRINPDDRALFEKGDIQSFFGFSENDCIEFKMYDARDNELPQQKYGNVRYIPLNSENIKDYFLIAEGTVFQKYQLPTEYFIDAERLIKEAGYNNGIFKVQITLLNKRVGSELNGDKLRIAEISPSRLEVRLFPVENNNSAFIGNLKDRFGIFVNNKEFREDTIRYALSAIESIKPNFIASTLKATYGEQWFQSFISEYKINGFDIFCTKIYEKFVEASLYEFTNRISDVNDLNYGKPKSVKAPISLSKNDIIKSCEKIIIQILNSTLPTPQTQRGGLSQAMLESYDAVEQILQTKQSDLNINTTPPVVKVAAKVNLPDISNQLNVIKDDFRTKNLPFPKQIILPDVPINTPINEPTTMEVVQDTIKPEVIRDAVQAGRSYFTNPADPLGFAKDYFAEFQDAQMIKQSRIEE